MATAVGRRRGFRIDFQNKQGAAAPVVGEPQFLTVPEGLAAVVGVTLADDRQSLTAKLRALSPGAVQVQCTGDGIEGEGGEFTIVGEETITAAPASGGAITFDGADEVDPEA